MFVFEVKSRAAGSRGKCFTNNHPTQAQNKGKTKPNISNWENDQMQNGIMQPPRRHFLNFQQVDGNQE